MNGLIDSHVHLWDASLHDYPWLNDEPRLQRRFGMIDLSEVADDLDGIVVVEAGCHAGHAMAELEWIEAIAADAPLIRGIVVQVPLERGIEVTAQLAQIAAKPLVVGVRRNIQDEAAGFMSDPGFVRGVQSLAAVGLPFDACIRHHQLPELATLVDRCPQITFILDHLGKPPIAPRIWQSWRDHIAVLAARPNVVAKLSGLTTEAGQGTWLPADIKPYLLHALEVFGPDRCMFGSDWPVCTLATRYDQWLQLVVEVDELAPSARAQVLKGTAARVYGLAA